MRAAAVLALLTVPAAATAQGPAHPLALEAGPAVLALDLPHGDDQLSVGASVAAALHPEPSLPLGLRMQVAVGEGGASTRALGVAGRAHAGPLVIDVGLAAASVVGERGDVSSDLQPRGIGIALDVHAQIVVGPLTLAAFAVPTWVFASDAVAREAALRSAITAGIAVGILP